MSDPTTHPDAGSDDWPEVWQRAREKARRLRGGSPPLIETEATRARQVDEHESDLQSLIARFMARAEHLPRDLPPEPPAEAPRSAVEVRLGWYIPPRHTEDTLDSYRPITASQHEALQATRDFVASVLAGEGGALALIGGVGTGKSHLLYGAIRALNEAGVHAAAGGWYDLADLLRQAKYGHEETTARIRKSRLLAAAALGIDEIRPTSGTEYDTTELSQLMTRAYRERQGVLVTSNYADEKLSRIVGLAASSRLTQVVVEGPDLRQPENRHLRAIR